MRFRALSPGDSMPPAAFHQADGQVMTTHALGGAYLLICFIGTALPDPAMQLVQKISRAFAASAQLLFVWPGPPRAIDPGPRSVFDPERRAAIRFGAARLDAPADAPCPAFLALFDPMSRLVAARHLLQDKDMDHILQALAQMPPPARCTGRPLQAPVLYLPRVFAPALCARLIAGYHDGARALTGVMRHIGGQTIGVHDPAFKRRRDYLVRDPALIATIQARIRAAVLPELKKAFGFTATRMERYLVGCYSAGDAGHFAPHRDNTTPATAHRRFAISINLNDDFEGGAVSFPEYGPDGFRAPTGTAVVFGCGLMHAVAPVTQGARYAFLPFVYDEAGAKIRQACQTKPAQKKTAPARGAVLNARVLP